MTLRYAVEVLKTPTNVKGGFKQAAQISGAQPYREDRSGFNASIFNIFTYRELNEKWTWNRGRSSATGHMIGHVKLPEKNN